MSRSRDFLWSLLGPHVMFAFAVGVIQGSLVLAESPTLLVPFTLGLVSAAAAVLAMRLSGNTLVAGCAGALFALHAETDGRVALYLFNRNLGRWYFDLVAVGCGLLAAGVRLLPTPNLAREPLVGKREALALCLLMIGAVTGRPSILAMPVLILLADASFAPGGLRPVARRTALLFLLHAVAVSPALFMLDRLPQLPGVTYGLEDLATRFVSAFEPYATIDTMNRHAGMLSTPGGFPVLVIVLLGAVLVIVLRSRIRQTLVLTAAFAVVWAAAAELPRLMIPSGRVFGESLLAIFGFALLVPTILWRIAVALAAPLRMPIAEAPIPSVPALRDFVRKARAEPRMATGKVGVAAGMRSAVDVAVSGAVAATLEQIRLAFRGPHVTEPPGTPEQVLWNRLMTQGSGGPAPAERPEESLARWREIHKKHVAPRLRPGSDVLCAGATPWPLVVVLGEASSSVTLIERSARTARLAADDVGGAPNVTVLRHDGRALGPIGDGTVDAVLALIEPTVASPAQLLALLQESKRVLRKGGVAGIAFADLALKQTQDALARGAGPASFTNRESVETLARLAGFGPVESAAGVLGTASIAWMKS